MSLVNWKERSAFTKTLIVLVSLFLVYFLLLALSIGMTGVAGDNTPGIPFNDTAHAASTYSATEIATIGPGLFDDTKLQATLQVGDQAALAAFLPYAIAETSNTTSLSSIASIVGHPIQAGCHGKVSRRISLYIRGYFTHPVIAWRRVAIDQWCWRASTGTISSTYGDPDDGKWAFPGYCWDNVTYRKGPVTTVQWYSYAQATLKSCTRLSPQRTIKPSINYHGATTTRGYGFWRFDNTPSGYWYHN